MTAHLNYQDNHSNIENYEHKYLKNEQSEYSFESNNFLNLVQNLCVDNSDRMKKRTEQMKKIKQKFLNFIPEVQKNDKVILNPINNLKIDSIKKFKEDNNNYEKDSYLEKALNSNILSNENNETEIVVSDLEGGIYDETNEKDNISNSKSVKSFIPISNNLIRKSNHKSNNETPSYSLALSNESKLNDLKKSSSFIKSNYYISEVIEEENSELLNESISQVKLSNFLKNDDSIIKSQTFFKKKKESLKSIILHKKNKNPSYPSDLKDLFNKYSKSTSNSMNNPNASSKNFKSKKSNLIGTSRDNKSVDDIKKIYKKFRSNQEKRYFSWENEKYRKVKIQNKLNETGKLTKTEELGIFHEKSLIHIKSPSLILNNENNMNKSIKKFIKSNRKSFNNLSSSLSIAMKINEKDNLNRKGQDKSIIKEKSLRRMRRNFIDEQKARSMYLISFNQNKFVEQLEKSVRGKGISNSKIIYDSLLLRADSSKTPNKQINPSYDIQLNINYLGRKSSELSSNKKNKSQKRIPQYLDKNRRIDVKYDKINEKSDSLFINKIKNKIAPNKNNRKNNNLKKFLIYNNEIDYDIRKKYIHSNKYQGELDTNRTFIYSFIEKILSDLYPQNDLDKIFESLKRTSSLYTLAFLQQNSEKYEFKGLYEYKNEIYLNKIFSFENQPKEIDFQLVKDIFNYDDKTSNLSKSNTKILNVNTVAFTIFQ